jgi:hypothetical protein
MPQLVWFLAAAAAFAASVFLHLPATDAAEWLLPRMGLVAYDRLWTGIAIALGAAALLYVGWRERWMASMPVRAAFGFVVIVALSHALLITAPIEYVHYPQYALIALLLAQAGLPLEIAWLIATASGAVDELHQRLTMTRGTPDYFDWNDVVLNAAGAALGLLLLGAGRRTNWTMTFSRRATLSIVGVTAIAALVVAPPVLRPYLTETPRHTWFRVLSPLEAVGLLAVIWMSVRRLPERGRSAPS